MIEIKSAAIPLTLDDGLRLGLVRKKKKKDNKRSINCLLYSFFMIL